MTIKSYAAPAASNYSGNVGLAVYLSDSNEVTLWGDKDGVVPLGIIVYAENENGGQVGVCVEGECKAIAGGALAHGTATFLTTDEGDDTGRLIAAAAGEYYVARLIDNSSNDQADGDYIDVLVCVGQLNAA